MVWSPLIEIWKDAHLKYLRAAKAAGVRARKGEADQPVSPGCRTTNPAGDAKSQLAAVPTASARTAVRPVRAARRRVSPSLLR